VLVGSERLGEVGVEAAALEAACFADCQEPFDGAATVVGLGAVATLFYHEWGLV
jgi:hypothetical protein